MQHLGEAILAVPDGWHNQSINVYTANAPGLAGMTITVNRDTISLGVDFDGYVRAQSAKLKQNLKGFEPIRREATTVDGREAFELEFRWHSPDAGPVHQLLLTINDTSNNARKVMNLAATMPGTMNDAQATLFKNILRSLRFQPSGGQAVADAD